MNRYKYKVIYSTGRSEIYEIEAAQHSDAYTVLIDSALHDADDDELLIRIELIEFVVIWELDEDDLEEQ